MFAAAVVVIALLKPGPTEVQVMRWMEGMMSAMHNSLMGASMDNAVLYNILLQRSAQLTFLMMLLGLVIGLPLKIWRKKQ